MSLAKKRAASPRKKKGKRGDKANAIRDQYESVGWETAPKDVIAALAEAGIKVTPAQVSNIRTKHLKGAPGRKLGRPRVNGTLTLEQVIAVDDFAKSFGGVDALRQALDVLDTFKTT